jgi:hypothetical protein
MSRDASPIDQVTNCIWEAYICRRSWTFKYRILLFCIAESVKGLGYGLYNRGSTPDRDKRLFSSPRIETCSGAYSASCPIVTRGRGVKLTNHLHTVLRLRIHEVILPHSVVFMWWCLIKHMRPVTHFSILRRLEEVSHLPSSQPGSFYSLFEVFEADATIL